MNIKTKYDPPPIPERNRDWVAYDDDTYEGASSPLGQGPTADAAVRDLLEQLGPEAVAASFRNERR